MGTKTSGGTGSNKHPEFHVKKESPNMGTKTSYILTILTFSFIAGEKRIPKHGDENT